jgi:serine/threonine-protein kinase
MAKEDRAVSRHHFILEINPPDAVLRDLGSLNGTWVNDVKHGGREKGETPEQGAQRRYQEVQLKNGDRIRVGETVLTLTIEAPLVCSECNRGIAEKERVQCERIDGKLLCRSCKEKIERAARSGDDQASLCCAQCGRDMAGEMGDNGRGDHLCRVCRENAEEDPALLLARILRHNGKGPPTKVQEIGGYAVEKKLGAGGFGAVYRARRQRDGQMVALKVMLAKVAVDDDARAKFIREIEALKKLRHPNIVALLEHGSGVSAFYYVMELCEGGSLADWVQRHGGKLPLAKAGPIMLQTLEGLAHAHRHGFVHRDLKPGNLLLAGTTGCWIAKIGDFGIAKSFQQAGLSGMTVTGNYAGPPGFMPREQVINFRQVKPTSDVWSLGASFYAMLTGQLPRDLPRGVDPIQVVLEGKIVPIRRRDASIPKKLAEVIDRSLALKPQDRFQDAVTFHRAIKQAL